MKSKTTHKSGNLPTVHDSANEISPLLHYIQYSEFKRLLDQISFALERENHRSLAVLSEYPGEGKTFFVAVLALGYSSLLNKRVLIINTVSQTQNRSLHLETVYQTKARPVPGAKNAQPDQTAPTIDVVSPHVDPDGGETESSDFQVGQYIRAARDSYHLIISDTCALSMANRKNVDPVVIARHSDTSILLTSSLSLDRAKIAGIKTRLAQWKIPLLGTIHNSWAKP